MREPSANISCDATSARRTLAGVKATLSPAEIIKTLTSAGEQLLTIAREGHGYKDRTGNLSSSLGYVVTRRGRIVRRSNFNPVSVTGSDGAMSGESFAENIAGQYASDEYALIVVAGMRYASCVENGHTARNGRFVQGRVVLSEAKNKAPSTIGAIVSAISRTLNLQR